MPDRVAIVGVGHTQFRATSPGLSYKELMFEAATKAYADAGVDPRRDVDSFVCWPRTSTRAPASSTSTSPTRSARPCAPSTPSPATACTAWSPPTCRS